ncbi:MAG: UDP-glucose/GDP-mannose dehydrogenase family protein [Chloroflexi bacterium SZAS-1]|jgi:UDPglucose 6-dehydrogenase|nr:UDP-glucose/GDP-mannose dehydrogenase family protein [Chloroflexi bacterium SZAS-1]HNP84820.1 nucleotide sugar dehydrogenase [Kouleothrix sp.]
MKIIVAGTGFVGLTHAAVCSEYGHEVYAYDIDEKKLNAYRSGEAEQINHYVNEPGLAEIIAENKDRYLFFSSDLEGIIEGTDAIFLCLPTPPNVDGSSDLSFYFKAVDHICTLLAKRADTRRIVLINKSTVPIGTARQLERKLHEYNVPNAGVASNPEFLPEGDAVEKSRRPDRVTVGADTDEDFRIIRRIYSQFVNHVRIRYIETTPETAEAIKYVANTLLLTYISFWNGVGARLGETFANIRMEDLKRGVTADNRISTWGSYVSNGAGGSCFGKDIQSLIYQLKSAGQPTDVLQSVYNINEYQKTYLIDRASREAGARFNQKKVALLGLAFKQRTNDMRDASSLKVVETLLARGVSEIRAYDPVATAEAKRFFNPENNHLFEKISYYKSAKEALAGTDMVFISTDWEEFRGLSRTIEQAVKPPFLVIDGRRMIPDYNELTERGYGYIAVGSPYMPPK